MELDYIAKLKDIRSYIFYNPSERTFDTLSDLLSEISLSSKDEDFEIVYDKAEIYREYKAIGKPDKAKTAFNEFRREFSMALTKVIAELEFDTDTE